MVSSGLANYYEVNNYSVSVKAGSEVARRLNLCYKDAFGTKEKEVGSIGIWQEAEDVRPI